MLETLLLGILLGMRHALEADHIAAVATMVDGHNAWRSSLRLGAFWGIGHSLPLLLLGAGLLFSGMMIPDQLATTLEFAVGLMLVVLGLDVMRRLWQRRVTLSIHHHQGHAHLHLVSGNTAQHHHPETVPWRALLIGIMHGMAGSAALVLLTLQTVASPWLGLAYIICFGIGSIVGMAVVSCAIAMPLRHALPRWPHAMHWVQGTTGAATLSLGCYIILTHQLSW